MHFQFLFARHSAVLYLPENPKFKKTLSEIINGARAVSSQITADKLCCNKTSQGGCRNWTMESAIFGALLNPHVHMDDQKKNFEPCAETWREKDSAKKISDDNYCKDCPVFRLTCLKKCGFCCLFISILKTQIVYLFNTVNVGL